MKLTKIHFDIYNKILFAVLGILLITWFSSYVMEKIRPVKKEAFFGIPIPGAPKDGSDDMVDKLKDFGEQLKNIPGIVENWFEDKIIHPITDFFKGLDELFNHGIPEHLACGKSMADSGFNGGLQVLNIQFICFWDKFVKLFNGDCTLYYVVDAICKIITIIFIRFPLTVIKAIFGADLHFLVDMFKSLVLVPINEVFIMFVGFGFLEWSDTIIQRCYKCQGQIKDTKGNVVYSDSKSFGDWSTLYTCSNTLLQKGIDKIFFSAFPSKHWDTWYHGNHTSGWDDAT
jgi:hypothetical protein